jgi:Ca-activated chloride channel family protein
MNVMLVVDVSESMRVTDISPSRLRRAQIEISELLDRATGIRLGIVVFAARPHLYVPLTHDHEAIRYYLKSLDDLVLPTAGSGVNKALSMARNELTTFQHKQQPLPSAIILMSDGDFAPNRKETPVNAIKANGLGDSDIPLYVMGLGHSEGSAIPIKGGGWLEYDGQAVISQLNEPLLSTLAKDHGGRYTPSYNDDSDWKTLYDNGLAEHIPAFSEQTGHAFTNWHEYFPWFLLPGCFFLFVALTPYTFGLIRSGNGKSALMSVVLFLMLGLHQPPAFADNQDIKTNIRDAYQLYQTGDYAEALILYGQISGFAGRMGEAACHYRLKAYASAVTQYSQAVLMADTDHRRAIALYNLGNSYFQQGDYASAIHVYEDTLRYDPQHEAAAQNLELSIELEKNIRTRLQLGGRTNRQGSGSLLAEVTESQMTRQDSRLSIAETSTQEQIETPLPDDNEESGNRLDDLINKGIDFIKLAAAKQDTSVTTPHKATKSELVDAQLKMGELSDTQALLWKQVFEAEEGFSISLPEPRTLPGVTPW